MHFSVPKHRSINTAFSSFLMYNRISPLPPYFTVVTWQWKSLPETSEAASISHKMFKPPLFHVKVFFNVFMHYMRRPSAPASGSNTKAASRSHALSTTPHKLRIGLWQPLSKDLVPLQYDLENRNSSVFCCVFSPDLASHILTVHLVKVSQEEEQALPCF